MSKHKHEHEHKHKPTLKIFRPKDKGHICMMSLPAANSPWLSKNIKPKHTPSAIRITTSASVSGVLHALITHEGTLINTDLNRGDPLVPSAMYVFEVMLHHHDSINFTYDTTNGTIEFARFEEVDAAAASGRSGY